MKNKIIFLGSGGGGAGFMSRQTLRTGGKYVELDGLKFLIDPGPGTLVYASEAGLDMEEVDGILLSHLHPDHSTDTSALLDGMEKYFIIAEKHCIKKSKEYFPCISKFHIQKATLAFAATPRKTYKVGKLKIKTVKTDHYGPAVGFKIIGSKTIGYPTDGTYFEGQEKYFEDCDVLIFNSMIPHGNKSRPKWHMAVDDIITMVNKMKNKPRLIVLQHFGFWMIDEGINKQAKIVEQSTKVRTIAAKDFMEIDLDTLKTRVLKE
jgi:ribonuclease BN (tRNA processing enzyme)